LAWGCLFLIGASCGADDPAVGDGTDGEATAADVSTSSDVDQTSTASTGSATSSTSEGTTTGVESSSGARSESDASSTTGDDSGGWVGPGCPESLPAEWILCEDFETPGTMTDYFGSFWTNADLVSVEDGVGLEGGRALEIGHDPSIYSSGSADIRFGQGPMGGTVHAPEETYREVWVRFSLRTQDGWPDAGIAEAVEVMSLAGQNRAIAVDATIYSPTEAQAQAIAWSCVHDSRLLCTGQADWSNPNLQAVDDALGSSELYGSAAAGEWQCHEVHVRLDDPGMADGVFEVLVDNELEVALEGLELVDAWSGAALNTVRFASFWSAPERLDHWVDDVIVSSAPIGCP
jgi:hypothetical protein